MTLTVLEHKDGEKVFRTASKKDLLQFHPTCDTCIKRKGIHGQDGTLNVFCQHWNRPVEKEGYCSNHSEL